MLGGRVRGAQESVEMTLEGLQVPGAELPAGAPVVADMPVFAGVPVTAPSACPVGETGSRPPWQAIRAADTRIEVMRKERLRIDVDGTRWATSRGG